MAVLLGYRWILAGLIRAVKARNAVWSGLTWFDWWSVSRVVKDGAGEETVV
ncbi:MAG: hypothetical protein M3036_10220 [Bifidobacteriales bacterium]|nr:hypothetical protein [Bifidobacteriales bacterium]